MILPTLIRRPATDEDLALATPPGWDHAHARRGVAPTCITRPRCESPFHDMSPLELHNQLLELHAERHPRRGDRRRQHRVLWPTSSATSRARTAAFVGAAVTEIASFRGPAVRPELRLASLPCRPSRRLDGSSQRTCLRRVAIGERWYPTSPEAAHEQDLTSPQSLARWRFPASAQAADTRRPAIANASQECRTERGATAATREAFAARYGTNANKRNAFGKCVSAKSRARPESTDDAQQTRPRPAGPSAA